MKKFLLILLAVALLAVYFLRDTFCEIYDTISGNAVKPVIYLYPEEEPEVSVKGDYAGELTCVYPEYGQGWNVTARPDGTIFDEKGQEYYCLYWEGSELDCWSMDRGFCVPGSDTSAFL